MSMCSYTRIRTPRSCRAYIFGEKRENVILFKKEMIDNFLLVVFLSRHPTIHLSKADTGR